jgi:CheY-like chemotaxis protein/two-component sensor histidine kinase
VTDLRAAEQALRESDRRKTEFLAVLSHELRNPLAPILTGVEILESSAPGSAAAARARAIIRRQTEHLARLVDDLLDVTRVSRGKIELRRVRLDLRDVVRRTLDDHRDQLDGRSIALEVALPPEPVWLDADATRMAQVVGNLLHNAAKFTPAGGAVCVTLSALGGQAELAVRDTGIGIDAQDLPRLFEPFAQGDQGLARSAGGLGLGLALVKGLVELHGGRVRAASDGPGRGAEIAVVLPLAEAEPAALPAAPREAAPAGRDVLVIEDNEDAASTLADLLELNGHRVRIARDGRTGLALAQERIPDVIFCDIGLPDMDGYEVARALRAVDALRSVRLVALTGYAQPDDRRRAAAAGFDAHLAKPPPAEEIAAALR